MLSTAFVTDAGAQYGWTRELYANTISDVAASGDHLYWATSAGLVELGLTDASITIHRRSLRTLPTDTLTAVAADADGNIWCGTDGYGLAIRTPGGQWRRLSTFDGLPNARVLSLEPVGDQMRIGTAEGFVTITGIVDPLVSESCTVLDPCVDELPSLTIQAILDRVSEVWYGTSAGPVRAVDDGGGLTLTPVLGGLSSLNIRSFAEYDGEVWVATDDGAYRANAAGTGWIATSGLTDARDLLAVDGRLLCTSPNPATGRGVYEWNGSGWTRLGSTFGNAARPIALASAGDGSIWVGTTAGVRRLSGSNWGSVIAADGLPLAGRPWSIATGDDETWMGYFDVSAAALRTSAGWVGVTDTSTDDGFERRPVQAISVDPTGATWFAHCCCSGGGCFVDRVDASLENWIHVPVKNARAFAHGRSYTFIGSGAEDESVAGAGLAIWAPPFGPDSVQVVTAETSNLTSNTISALAMDDAGRLWVGHRQNGIDRFTIAGDPTDGDFDATPVRYVAPALPSNSVFALAADGARMWAGTFQGLALFDEGELIGTWGAFELGSPLVRAIAIASDRSAWVATDAGLVRMRPNALGTYDVERYRFPDLSNDRVLGVATRGLDVWVATDNGVTIGRPSGGSGGSSPSTLAGSVYPNPFRGDLHDGIRLADVSVPVSGEVYDAAGGLVATFRDIAPGAMVWNGRVGGADGQLAAPGLYVVVARSGDHHLRARVAVID